MNHVDKALDQLDVNDIRFEELLNCLSEKELNLRADESSWSIAQHIQHLVIAGRQFSLTIKAATAEARKQGLVGEGPFSYNLLGRFFLKILEPPVSMRVKSPKAAVPEEFVAVEALKGEFTKMRRKLREACKECAGIDLGRVKARHPAQKMMNFNLAVWLEVAPSHERRHLWHIDNALSKLGLSLNSPNKLEGTDVS